MFSTGYRQPDDRRKQVTDGSGNKHEQWVVPLACGIQCGGDTDIDGWADGCGGREGEPALAGGPGG